MELPCLSGCELLQEYFQLPFPVCISQNFTAVNRHHDQGKSYKGQHLIGAGLQFQRFSPLSSWQEAWQPAGSDGAGEGGEWNSTLGGA